MENVKGFFGSLFDMRFKNFITPKIISVLYFLILLLAALAALFAIVMSFSESFGFGLVFFLAAILGFLISMIVARVWLEVIMILFKIEENTRRTDTEKQP